MSTISHDTLRQAVRERYSQVALGQTEGCGCSGGCCAANPSDPKEISRAIGYSPAELDSVVEGANLGLGCGNPQAIAQLKPGESVLDLGSGAGFDCFLAARAVGENGWVVGVDMTPVMVSKARENAHRQRLEHVEFRLGEIEALPVADASIDVVISNCVINLSPDKGRVFQEAFRVLRPGGRLAISDVVAFGEIPGSLLSSLAAFTGCMAGAASVAHIEKLLHESGFVDVRVAPKEGSGEFIDGWLPGEDISRFLASATIAATKPRA